MINSLKTQILRHLSNVPGWGTSRKIVVIESDDWGSIRMPSRDVFNEVSKIGVTVGGGDSERYNLYDTLATPEDLNALFETLQKVKDKNNHAAVITAVSVVANPDFEKIKASGFQEYFYEPFTHTLERYYGNQQSFNLWKEGLNQGLFIPQFHGREHLNVSEWMRALQANDQPTMVAFKNGFWGFNNLKTKSGSVSFQAAFDLYNTQDLSYQKQVIVDGLSLFEKLLGYRASFFVPPNGQFNTQLEEVTSGEQIKFLSCSKIQNEPLGNGVTKKRFHKLGQQNKYKQIYFTRNCFFEPNQSGKDHVGSCLQEIKSAFMWNKPAIISSHRVNYIGAHDENNRRNGLNALNSLLKRIVKQWPDVEFMSSDKLGEVISNSR